MRFAEIADYAGMHWDDSWQTMSRATRPETGSIAADIFFSGDGWHIYIYCGTGQPRPFDGGVWPTRDAAKKHFTEVNAQLDAIIYRAVDSARAERAAASAA